LLLRRSAHWLRHHVRFAHMSLRRNRLTSIVASTSRSLRSHESSPQSAFG